MRGASRWSARLRPAAGVHAGILLDLQGPKIRLGTFENGGCVLETGSQFRITTEQIAGTCASRVHDVQGFR